MHHLAILSLLSTLPGLVDIQDIHSIKKRKRDAEQDEEPKSKVPLETTKAPRFLSRQQREDLSEFRFKPGTSEEERWFELWELLFPEAPRPGSPYMNPEAFGDFAHFLEIFQNRGAEILMEELQKAAGIIELDLRPESDTSYVLQRALFHGLNTIQKRWLSGDDGPGVAADFARIEGPRVATPGDSGIAGHTDVTPTGATLWGPQGPPVHDGGWLDYLSPNLRRAFDLDDDYVELIPTEQDKEEEQRKREEKGEEKNEQEEDRREDKDIQSLHAADFMH
ncbi:hypothetical protein B0T22DRAFT_445812 [Podospora appendiculata]|uniref:Uncharacterized protein n=1 Tax=Podospora appendiculata TaxID=314037 RepID=A0AAE1C788_9PEZI|nr:hypothetical protein B0T22DRAFT_445812 [Podospora appendiculata]